MNTLTDRIRCVLTTLLACGWPAVVWSQTTPIYTPHAWIDCSVSKCRPAEVLRYLLWSRESDKNECNALLKGGGVPSGTANTTCSELIRISGFAPIDEFNVVDGLTNFLNSQTSTFPIGTSSAGFALTATKSHENVLLSQSTGPLFVERALTSGRNNWSVNFNWQRTHWASLDGTSFDDFHTEEGFDSAATDLGICRAANRNCPSQRWTSNVDFLTTTLVVGGTYGLTNRFDLGVSVPIINAVLSGTSWRANGYSMSTPQGSVQRTTSASGSAWGVADVSVRGKYNFIGPTAEYDRKLALSVKAEVRLDTGNHEKLIGSGKTQFKTALLGEFSNARWDPERLVNRLSPHFNLGYTSAGDGVRIRNAGTFGHNQYTADFDIDLSNEFDYSIGIDVPLFTPGDQAGALTLAFDVIGRTLLHGAEFRNVVFLAAQGNSESQPFLFEQPYVTLLLGTFGFKARLGHSWLATANLLFPMSDKGVTPHPTVVVGVERAFFNRNPGKTP